LHKRDQKAALDKLFRDYGVGRYEGALGARIAVEMTTIPAEIAAFFTTIKQKMVAPSKGT
jgi:hypothetical protein